MGKKLKIAVMVTGEYTIPLPKRLINAPVFIAKVLAEGLNKLGHKVTFFAPEGSKVKVNKLVSGNLKPLNSPSIHRILKDPYSQEAKVKGKIIHLWEQYLIALIYQEALKGKFDIIHIHPVDRALPFAMAIKGIPMVYTLHDPIYPWRAEIYRLFQTKNQYFVSISNAQRKPAPDLNYVATIYNGLDISLFPYSEKTKDYFLFVGRLQPEKGVAEAVEAARKAKVKLLIIGLPTTGAYWDERIKPHLGKNITSLGFVPYRKLCKYYQKAKATLVPIQWEEPFGLVMIESMACGTPVIAFDRGSVREVVKDGETGFIVKNIDEMSKAIKKINQIDRKECRKWVEENFTVKKMVEKYEKIFRKILEKEN